jgi:hypothetical protein
MYSIAKSSTSQSAEDISFVEKMDALIEQQKKDLEAQLTAWQERD